MKGKDAVLLTGVAKEDVSTNKQPLGHDSHGPCFKKNVEKCTEPHTLKMHALSLLATAKSQGHPIQRNLLKRDCYF